MSPFDLVGIAKLNGLDLIALTDHNTTRNCRAAKKAADEYGIGFIPGVEVTTTEDIHCICLFPDVDTAEKFDKILYEKLLKIKNKRKIFGNQIVVNLDGSKEYEPILLISAVSISIMDLPKLVEEFGGICYPAHIDKDSNGLISTLGFWPEDLNVAAAEVNRKTPCGIPESLKIICASDAHQIEDMSETGFPLPLSSPSFNGLKKYIGK